MTILPDIIFSMRFMKWMGVLAGIVLIIACFLPWITVETRNIIVKGMDAAGTTFGKPGFLHLLLSGLFLTFTFISRIWAKRINLLVTAVNLAWAVRNFFMISACQGGECPEKHTGIYLILFTSLLMLLSSLFPDMKVPRSKIK